MRTIETNALVTEDGQLIVPMPADIVPGEHRVVVVIEEQPVAAPQKKRPPLKFSAYPVGLIDDTFTFRREELYDTDRG